MKAIILHASAGGGHRSAAEALKQSFAESNTFTDVIVKDILDFTPGVFRRTYARGYLDIVKYAPELWGYMFSKSDNANRKKWKQSVRSVFNRINTPTLMKFWNDFDPDISVSTHFMPLEIVSSKIRRGRLKTSNFCVVTDYAVHALWMVNNVDCYYTANSESARQLQRNGQPEAGICVSGIPISPTFSQRFDRKVTRRALGLQSDIFTILLMSGGHGVGPTVELMNSFSKADFPCQLIVVTGSNRKLQSKCASAAETIGVPCSVLGFVTNVAELVDASDIVVSKPGGLTCSEVMARGKPMFIVNPIPGQEQRNCEYLLEKGAAMRLLDPTDAPWKIRQIAADPAAYERVSQNAASLGAPLAAARIRDDILRRLSERSVS